jgi:Protein of unknown function (DUF4239)
MIDLWLRLGFWGIVVVPFVVLYAIAAAIVWLTHLSPMRPFFVSCIGITGPFFASVAVLFSLFAAFLANDVQHRAAEAQAAVLREADGIRTILRLSEALGAPGTPLKTAVVDYGQSVLDKEWPKMQAEGKPVEDLQAFRDLTLAVMAPDLTAAAPPAAHQAILSGLVEIRQARRERFSLFAHESDPVNWLGMLILGVATQFAIAVVQLDKMRPQALALFVFTTAFAATAVLVGLAERPFTGKHIPDAPLRAAIATANM